jgi:hypothetical protein
MTAVVISNRDTIRAAAEQLLTNLGDQPATVAERLHAAGIRGERCNEGACPIATYLLRSDLGLYSVAVSGNIATLRYGDRGAYTVFVDVPDVVEEFIYRFDNGAYDELLKATCVRCKASPTLAFCCSSHNALLCHGCYRRTHFVEVCVEGCTDCAREGLGVVLGGAR